MGKRNYLIEGVSGTGKSSVRQELENRGFQAIDGDNELAYQGNPETGEKTEGFTHQNHIWDLNKLKGLIYDKDSDVTFFCGGSRNFHKFRDLLDGIFVLELDKDTLVNRLNSRPNNVWGGKQTERDLILKLHETKEDLPKNGTVIDATQPLSKVVDDILAATRQS